MSRSLDSFSVKKKAGTNNDFISTKGRIRATFPALSIEFLLTKSKNSGLMKDPNLLHPYYSKSIFMKFMVLLGYSAQKLLY